MKRFLKFVFPSVMLALLVLLLMAYVVGRLRYHLEFINDWIFFISCLLAFLLLVYLLLAVFQPKKRAVTILTAVVCVILSVLWISAASSFSSKTSLSVSPDGQHVFVLKTKKHQTTYLQNYFWIFAKAVEHLPYSTEKIGKVVWLDNDTAAVTYTKRGSSKNHVYVGTYGYRHTTQSDYYVSMMARGNWTNGKNTLTVNGSFTVNGQNFDYYHAVQFGTSAVVLTTDSAQYVVEIPKNFPADPQVGTKIKLMLPDLEHPKVETLSYTGTGKGS